METKINFRARADDAALIIMRDRVLLTVSGGVFQKHKASGEQPGRPFRNQAKFLEADDYSQHAGAAKGIVAGLLIQTM